MALTKLTADVENIQALSDKPNEIEGLTADQLKKKFDDAVIDIKTYNNDTLTVEIDTALALKAPLSNPTFTGTVVLPSTTSVGNVSNTELSYVNGVTSAIQTQIDDKTPNNGWTLANETWTYVSVDDPTGVIKVQADVTTKYSLGMRIKMTNSGNTIFGILTKIGTYGGDVAGYTYLTFLHEIDPSDSLALYLMANSAITLNYYSSSKVPFGFPIEKTKWTRLYTNTGDATTGVVASSATIVNWENHNLSVPIGAWNLSFMCYSASNTSSAGSVYQAVGLSTANNSFSDATLKTGGLQISSALTDISSSFYSEKDINLTTKTTYYLNTNSNKGGTTMYCVGTARTTVIKAVCTYL